MKIHCINGFAAMVLLISAILTPRAWAVSMEETYWDEIFQPAYKTATELTKKDPLRQKLFQILRPLVEKEAGQPVLFAGSLKVFKNWGFFTGAVLDNKGGAIEFDPMGNSDCAAVWLRTCKGWILVDFSIGHSDSFWTIWHYQYGVPSSLTGE